MKSPLDTILAACAQMKEMRKKATPGKWENRDSALSYSHARQASFYTTAEQPIRYGDFLNEREGTSNFVAHAANHAAQLASALEVMAKALELTQRHYQHPKHDRNWANYLFEKHKAALAEASAILEGK